MQRFILQDRSSVILVCHLFKSLICLKYVLTFFILSAFEKYVNEPKIFWKFAEYYLVSQVAHMK